MADNFCSKTQNGMTVEVRTDDKGRAIVNIYGNAMTAARNAALAFQGKTLRPEYVVNQIFKNS